MFHIRPREIHYCATECCFCLPFFSLAPFGKRSWKMFYCTLRDPLVMYLHKDERGFHKNQVCLIRFIIMSLDANSQTISAV